MEANPGTRLYSIMMRIICCWTAIWSLQHWFRGLPGGEDQIAAAELAVTVLVVGPGFAENLVQVLARVAGVH